MQDNDSEPFDLPDWGTDGAPIVVPEDVDFDDAVEPADVFLAITPELLRSTSSLPSTYRIRSFIGLVSAEGSATVGDDLDFQGAVAVAKSAALDRLSTDASTSGATAVVDIRLTIVARLNDVVVLAYGTALDVRTA